jgi:hypothetical protein
MKDYLAQLNPVLGFIHHGGRGDAFLLAGMIAIGVLAVILIATMDKSK